MAFKCLQFFVLPANLDMKGDKPFSKCFIERFIGKTYYVPISDILDNGFSKRIQCDEVLFDLKNRQLIIDCNSLEFLSFASLKKKNALNANLCIEILHTSYFAS